MTTNEQMVKILQDSNPEIQIQLDLKKIIYEEIDSLIQRGKGLIVYHFTAAVDPNTILEVLRYYSNSKWNARIRAEETEIKLILS